MLQHALNTRIILSRNPLDTEQIQNADSQLSLLLGRNDNQELVLSTSKENTFRLKNLSYPFHQLSLCKYPVTQATQCNMTIYLGLELRRVRQPGLQVHHWPLFPTWLLKVNYNNRVNSSFPVAPTSLTSLLEEVGLLTCVLERSCKEELKACLLWKVTKM